VDRVTTTHAPNVELQGAKVSELLHGSDPEYAVSEMFLQFPVPPDEQTAIPSHDHRRRVLLRTLPRCPPSPIPDGESIGNAAEIIAYPPQGAAAKAISILLLF
jgi:hypothetical protein